jgi:type I restriction enzyme S subunit
MQTLKLTKKYETYPEYKDSGVKWLGAIPSDWKMRKLSQLFKMVGSGTTPDEKYLTDLDVGIPWVNTGDLNDEYIELPSKKVLPEALKDISTLRLYSKKAVVIAMYGATIGKLGMPQFDFCTNQACCVLENPIDTVLEKYIYFWLLGHKKNIIELAVGGGQPNINKETVRSLKISLPRKDTQEKALNYLDQKTFLINQSIQNKIKLIEILKEKRTSVINTLIINTEGEKGKLKNYIQLNPSKKIASVTSPEDMVSFVPMEAISELGELQPQERKYKEVSSGFTYFRDGDVVLAKITPCYENGKAGVMKGLKNGFGFGTTEFMVLRPSNKILADYLYYVIFSDKFRKMGEVEMRGTAGQKRVTSSFVMNYELSIPDVKTQEKIVTELNKKMKMFDVAIAKVETSILYLKEFKTSLISNVVTGKIKV